MSDAIAQTPEAVALEMFKLVAASEGKFNQPYAYTGDRMYLFWTYSECLRVVRGNGGGQEPQEPMPMTYG